MRVLFVGGTGNISTACTKLALEKGIELFIMTRGLRAGSRVEAAKQIRADIRNPEQAAAALNSQKFDAVVDWIAYEPAHIKTDIALFRDITRQYVFISSATVYQKPPAHYLVTESTPLGNPFWQYARDKIACEEMLDRAFREDGFPATIVRPSLTYGETWLPAAIGGHDYTLIDRMKKGRKIIVHGDGQSLWTMTHNTDFAKGLIGLLGNPAAIGEHYHITSDEVLTWDAIYRTIGQAAGVDPDLIHIPSDLINALDAGIGAGLLGDKAFSAVFDNARIKGAVPGFRATVSFAEGIDRCMEWFGKDERRKTVSDASNQLMDRIIQTYLKAWPGQGE